MGAKLENIKTGVGIVLRPWRADEYITARERWLAFAVCVLVLSATAVLLVLL